MAGKIQLLAIILAISISVGYARSAKKIIMGQAASIGEFPHQVSLQTKIGWHLCGGSIISRTLILTAAHCIVDNNGNPKKDDIDVVVGTNDKALHTSGNVFRVVRRIYHNYNLKDSLRNDIAILKLDKPIAFNNLIRPAKLPLRDVPAGTRVMSSGWGDTTYDNRTKEGHYSPRYLQKLERTVVSQQECQEEVPGSTRIGPGQICTRSSNRAAICFGDSGGPLTYNDEVIGITSFVIRGCAQGFPDVYTRIHHYLPWIRKVEWFMANNATISSNTGDYHEVEL